MAHEYVQDAELLVGRGLDSRRKQTVIVYNGGSSKPLPYLSFVISLTERTQRNSKRPVGDGAHDILKRAVIVCKNYKKN